MQATLINNFHNTHATIRTMRGGFPNEVSERSVRRAWRKLCGFSGCMCSGVAGIRGGDYLVEGVRFRPDPNKYGRDGFALVTR